ncbi:MFS transporter [Novosphingobium sp. FSY-8]|uniref:MFS transporter n=1 Tax=Novosphingobium ovatum TaxID=1908523 RepID=A0ABW9XA27_9SPHN|nr:MFS transporter [Novosphingobium ovatum]NBC35355.1 MFS transporter [Novosphingobium ovatum]
MKRKALIGWGVGSFTSAALVGAVGLLHLRFMTDSLGLAMGMAGLLVVASKIYDAAIDPVVGVLADRTRTRWGRHRPYLVGGALLAAVSLVMLFNVPTGLSYTGLLVWSGASLLIFSTAYTLYRIPYLAIGRAITQDFHERSRLMTFSVYGSSFGGLAATAAAPWMLSLMGGDRAAHGLLAMVLAGLVALGGIATFLLIDATSEGHAATTPHITFRQAAAAIAANRPFRALIAFKVTMFAGLTLHGAALPFYTRHVLHAADKSLGSIFLLQTLGMMASQAGWVRIAGRIGRRQALMLAALAEAAAMCAWYLVPAGHPMPWALVLGGVEGLCVGGLFFGLYTVLTDTMDHARHHGPASAEGVLAGVFVMVEKGTAAFGTWVFSAILSAVGFVSAHDAGSVQSAGVVNGIVLSLSVLPAVAAVLACLFLRAPAQGQAETAGIPQPPAVVDQDAALNTALPTAMVAGAVAMVMTLALSSSPARADAARPGAPPSPPPAISAPATPVPANGVTIPRISAGVDGKSYLDTVTLPRAPGSDPLAINARLYTTDTEIGVSPPGTFIDWHRVSSPRLLIVLSGTLEVGLGDGSVHRLQPGTIVLANDTVGQGHTSRSVGSVPVMAMTVRLPREDPLRSRASSCPDGVAPEQCVANSLSIQHNPQPVPKP